MTSYLFIDPSLRLPSIFLILPYSEALYLGRENCPFGRIELSLEEKVLDYINKHTDDLIDIVRRLVEVDSVNPPGNEARVAEVVRKELDKIGVPYKTYEKEKERTNLIGWIGGSDRPSLMIVCHTDVVPAGEGWTYPPFKATVVGGKIYGRGVVDNKGQLASAIMAFKALKETGAGIPGRLELWAVADEEMGSSLGMRYLLQELGLRTDYALIAECNDEFVPTRTIEIAEKGSARTKLISKGRQAHGSTPERGINAIVKLAKVIARLDEKLGYGSRMPHQPHPLLGHPTLSVNVIGGGVAANVVPASCEATIDVRIVPGQTAESVKRDLEQIVEEIRKDDPDTNVRVEVGTATPATETSPGNPVVLALTKAIEKVSNLKPTMMGIGGITVAKVCILVGIPTAVFGPGDAKMWHVANECIDISELLSGAKIYALTAVELLR